MDLAASIHTWQSRLALGGLVVLLGWEIVQPFFRFYANDWKGWQNRGRHALVNVAIGLFNLLIAAIL